MTLKFYSVLEVVELRVRTKYHQAECSGSSVRTSYFLTMVKIRKSGPVTLTFDL